MIAYFFILYNLAASQLTSIKGREQIKTASANILRYGQQANQAAENLDALSGKLIQYCKSDR